MASRQQRKPGRPVTTPGQQRLQRRLGVFDSTAIGLGSMLGAGVFVVFAPAAALAGPLLTLAVAVAGVIAYCNAVASAQLAAKYPASGGTYVYGRRQLGEWPGFIAGWGFVTGKTASCAAMALTFGHYVAPAYATPLAVAAVVVLTGVNLLGITRTALLTRILLAVVLATLVFVAAASLLGPHPEGAPAVSAAPAYPAPPAGGWGVLPAAGLMFFAFAGYARIATLGEEVKDPARTIPRAILAALAGAFVIYLGLAAPAAVAPAAAAAGGFDGAVAGRGGGLAAQRRRSLRPGRGGGRLPWRAAGPDHRGRQDHAGDGAGTGPARPAGPGGRRPHRPVRRGTGRRRRRHHPAAEHRRDDRGRIFQLRRAGLLRRDQRRGLHAGRPALACAALAECAGLPRLPGPGRHPAAGLGAVHGGGAGRQGWPGGSSSCGCAGRGAKTRLPGRTSPRR